MASLDLFTIETIVEMVCAECSPQHDVHECECLNPNLSRSCQGLAAEREQISTLAALAVASRQFNAIVTPHLYHRPSCARWWLLARTLLTRPDLARRVRHLSTRGWEVGDIMDPSVPPEVRGHWAAQPTQGLFDGSTELMVNDVVLLVLLLCPEVEELDAVVDGEDMEELCEPSTLAKLKKVTLAYVDDKDGTVLQLLTPLMQASPNVETLVGWQVEATDEHATDLENLRHVRLEHSSISQGSLWDLLSSCPRLESFHYGAAGPHVGHGQFNADEAQDALVAHVPGLRSLRLDLNAADFYDDLLVDHHLMKDLTPLAELESLSLDTRCLLPHHNPHRSIGAESPSDDEVPIIPDTALVDLLPPSIRELYIARGSLGPDVANLGPALSKLAKAAPGRFPRLRTVEISGTETGSIEMFRPDFDSSGIEFRVSPDIGPALDEQLP